MSVPDGPGTREVAYRLFATEYDDATLEHSESDEERAPNYVVTPTGARVNRLFVVGVLTELERVNEDTLRARIADPTGVFVVYAGQYQPEAVTALERMDTPTFVAVTGKANVFSPDGSDRILTSVRPESISEVDAATRERWTVQTAEQTLDRVATMAAALGRDERGADLRATLESAGVAEGLASGVPLAIDHYGTTPAYLDALRTTALDAARLVAGETDAVSAPAFGPNESDDRVVDLDALAGVELDVDAESIAVASAASTVTATSESVGPSDDEPTDTADAVSADDDEPATTEESASGESLAPEGTDGADASGASESATVTEADAAEEPASDSTSDAETGGTAAAETEEAETAAEPTTTTEGANQAVESADPEGTEASSADPESDGDIGDFEPGTLGGDSDDADDSTAASEEETTDGLAAETDEMYEMDDEEREELEAEFGAEFKSGTEVDAPGEADIETPGEPEEAETTSSAAEAAEDATASDEAAAEGATPPDGDAGDGDATDGDVASTADADDGAATEPETADAAADATGSDDGDAGAADLDEEELEDFVVDRMADLDDGDGADREALLAAVVDETGSDPDAVADAIQDALMGGRCYEPEEGVLKPI